MWTTTYHRFPSRAAFVEASLAAGWSRAASQELEPPPGVALDIIGPLIGPPQITMQGRLVPGEIVDSCFT